MKKYLSIITNFGCHYKCPYCIVKTNGIDVPETTIKSLDSLMDRVNEIGANIISVSGGGDPLYNYNEHKDYYEKLFKICKENNLPLEMHTSYIESDFPYDQCIRIVYHLNSIKDLSTLGKQGRAKIRIVYVVTKDFIEDIIDDIYYRFLSNPYVHELSFRQMVSNKYTTTHYCEDYLKAGHNLGCWHYIQQNDYNTYFVEGNLYYKFSDIGLDKSK